MAKKIEVMKPSEYVDVGGINMFLTGQPGTGKTAFIGSAADLYPNAVLILDANGGMRTLADRNDIDVVDCKKWKQFVDTFDALYEGNHPYKVVAIDLASEMLRLGVKQTQVEGMQTNKGQPTLEGYGVANSRFIDAFRNYKLLATEKGIHVIFTSHSTETKDDNSGTIIVRPNLTPGTLTDVIGSVDVAGFMEVKRDKRLIHLVGNDRFWAKARIPASWGEVPPAVENPTFEKLLKVLKGEAIPVK